MVDQTPKRPYWESYEELWKSQNEGKMDELRKLDVRRLIKASRSQEELFIIQKNFLRPLGSEQSFYNLYRSRSLELGMQPSLVGINPGGQGQFVAPLAPQIFEKYPERKGLQALAVSRNLYPGLLDYDAIAGKKPLFQRSVTGGLSNWEAIPSPVKPISAHGKGFIFDLETTGLLGENAQIISAGVKRAESEQSFYASFEHNKKLNPQVEKIISIWQGSIKGKKVGEEKELITSVIEQFERDPGAGYNVKQFDIPMLLEASDRYGLRTRLQAALSKSEVLDVAEHAVSFVSRQMGGDVVGWSKGVTETLGIKPLGWQLSTMAKSFGYQASGEAHEAAEDVRATSYLRDVLADEEKAKSLFNKDIFLKSVRESSGRELPLYKDVANVANFSGVQPQEYYTKPFWEHVEGVSPGESRAKTLIELEQMLPKKAMALPVIEKAPFLQNSVKSHSILGLAVAAGAFALANNTFSGRDDYYNKIEAFSHKGIAQSQRHSLTDFGSGYQGINFGPYAGMLQTSWVPASSLGKSPQAIFGTIVTPKYDNEANYQDASSVMGSAAAVGTALHSLESAKMFSRGYVKDVEKTLFDPTTRISGRADVILESDEPLDIKSVDLANLQKIMNTGARPKDVSQLNWYMSQMGAERGYLKYQAREDPSQSVWMEIPFSEKILNTDLAKVRRAQMKMLRGLQQGWIDPSQIDRSSTQEELTKKMMKQDRLRPIPELEEEFTRQQNFMFEVQRRRVGAYEQPNSQRFSGHNSQYNTIKGFREEGMAPDQRHTYTDFGSGLVAFAKRITGAISRSFKGLLKNQTTFGGNGSQIAKEFLSSLSQSRGAGKGLLESVKDFGEQKGIRFLNPQTFADEFASPYAQKMSPERFSELQSKALERASSGAGLPSRGLVSIGSDSYISQRSGEIASKARTTLNRPEELHQSLTAMHEVLEILHTRGSKVKTPQFGSHLSKKIIQDEAFLAKSIDEQLFEYARTFRETEVQSAVGYKKTVSKIYDKAFRKIKNKTGNLPVDPQLEFGFAKGTSGLNSSVEDLSRPIQNQLSTTNQLPLFPAWAHKPPVGLSELKYASEDEFQASLQWSDVKATRVAQRNRSIDLQIGEMYKRLGTIPKEVPQQEKNMYLGRAEASLSSYIKHRKERAVGELNNWRQEVVRIMSHQSKKEIDPIAEQLLAERKLMVPFVPKEYEPFMQEHFAKRKGHSLAVIESEAKRLEGEAYLLENKIEAPMISPNNLSRKIPEVPQVDLHSTANLKATVQRQQRFAKLAESAHGSGLRAAHGASTGHTVCHSNTTKIR